MKLKLNPSLPLSLALLAWLGCPLASPAQTPTLVHAYNFAIDAGDYIGTAHGALAGAASISATGTVVLNGVDAYVDLPNNLVTGYTAITVEAWVTDTGSGNWARIYDFGNSTAGEDFPATNSSTGTQYMFLSGRSSAGQLRGGYTLTSSGSGEQSVAHGVPLATYEPTHVVWTSDAASQTARMFVNGRQVAVNRAFTLTPAALGPTVNNWLGRSQWSADAFFNGTLSEFRLYDGALNALQVAASFESGEDFPSSDPGEVTSVELLLKPVMPLRGVQQAQVLAAASFLFTLTDIDIADLAGVTYQSSDETVLTVDALGNVTAVGLGDATITVQYGALNDAVALTVVPADLATLKHRYSFAETGGTAVGDSMSGADGTLVNDTNAAFSGAGQLALGGVNAYVDLPNGIISALTNGTFETWVTLTNAHSWARVFDFGVSNEGDGQSGTGSNYVFLAAQNPMRYVLKPGGLAENPVLIAPLAFPQNVLTHVACTYNSDVGVAKLFVNGQLVQTAPTSIPLSELNDLNNWLGRAQFNDPYFSGVFEEFRIYEGSMAEGDVALSFAAGPDNLAVTNAGAELAMDLQVQGTMFDGQQAVVLLDQENVTGVNITLHPDIVFESSDPTVLTVSPTGWIAGHADGTATVTVRYHDLTDSEPITVSLGGAAPLVHRYPCNDFSNDLFEDVFGGAHGTLMGAAVFDGAGAINLNGSSGTYVDLPNGIISSLTDATFEAWVTWRGGGNWQRVFDFGSSDQGEGNAGIGRTYLLITPQSGGGVLRATISTNSNVAGAEIGIDATSALPVNALSHLVLTYDYTARTMSLYLNGAPVGSVAITIPLSGLNDVNNWLGRAQYNDPFFNGLIHEFRIYDTVLTAAQIATTAYNGPMNPDLSPGNPVAVHLSLPATTVTANRPLAATVTADYAAVSNINVTLGQGVVYTSSDPAVASVNVNGAILPTAEGTTTLTAEYQGVSDSVLLTVLPAPAPVVAGTLYVDLRPNTLSGDGTAWGNLGTLDDFNRVGGTANVVNDVAGTGLPGVEFGGFDAFVGPAAPAELTGAGTRSIEYWVYNPALAAEDVVVSWGRRGTTARNFSLNFGNNLVYGAAGQWGGAYDVGWNTAENVPTAGQWHHLVQTYDGGTSSRVYVDGALRVEKTLGGPLDTWPGFPINLGAQRENDGVRLHAGTYYTGFINSLRVHGGVLTADEAATNFAAGPYFVTPAVSLAMQPLDLAVGDGGQAAFRATARGTEPISYQWYRDDALIPGATDPLYVQAGVTAADDGATFYVVASNVVSGTAYTATSAVATLSVVSAVQALQHRYTFTTDASDAIGGADGLLMGNASISGGQVLLNGVAGTFVDLPNNLVTGYPSLTFEAWFTDAGSGNWSRLLDFGNTVAGEGVVGTGSSYLFFSVRRGTDANYRAAGKLLGPEMFIDAGPGVTTQRHMAWTIDAVARRAVLYLDGAPVGLNTAFSYHPATFGQMLNVWLGRSQFNDAPLNGSINEFRIYNAVLSGDQIAASFASGPDAVFFPPTLGILPDGADVILFWPVREPGFTLESTVVLGPAAFWNPVGGTPVKVGGEFRLTITPGMDAEFFRLVK